MVDSLGLVNINIAPLISLARILNLMMLVCFDALIERTSYSTILFLSGLMDIAETNAKHKEVK